MSQTRAECIKNLRDIFPDELVFSLRQKMTPYLWSWSGVPFDMNELGEACDVTKNMLGKDIFMCKTPLGYSFSGGFTHLSDEDRAMMQYFNDQFCYVNTECPEPTITSEQATLAGAATTFVATAVILDHIMFNSLVTKKIGSAVSRVGESCMDPVGTLQALTMGAIRAYNEPGEVLDDVIDTVGGLIDEVDIALAGAPDRWTNLVKSFSRSLYG